MTLTTVVTFWAIGAAATWLGVRAWWKRLDQQESEAPMECATMRRLREQGRILTTEQWFAQHRDHGEIHEEDAQHPSGKVRCLVCECGARLLTMATTEAA